jgi:hypothetical protein
LKRYRKTLGRDEEKKQILLQLGLKDRRKRKKRLSPLRIQKEKSEAHALKGGASR